ncbi:hypothetical protein ACTID9_10515 [Brevibacillus fluminis]|uniref:hypothetical protein n=1 Tax=Brevibacillus fluminis TaxID=511487 RepID=UPI003F899A9D
MRRSDITPEEAKKKYIREFLQTILNMNDQDDPASIKSLIAMLNGLLRVNTFIPPTIEIMSFIKQQKPTLYHATRKSITSTSNLAILFHLDADPKIVAQRLEEYITD